MRRRVHTEAHGDAASRPVVDESHEGTARRQAHKDVPLPLARRGNLGPWGVDGLHELRCVCQCGNPGGHDPWHKEPGVAATKHPVPTPSDAADPNGIIPSWEYYLKQSGDLNRARKSVRSGLADRPFSQIPILAYQPIRLSQDRLLVGVEAVEVQDSIEVGVCKKTDGVHVLWINARRIATTRRSTVGIPDRWGWHLDGLARGRTARRFPPSGVVIFAEPLWDSQRPAFAALEG